MSCKFISTKNELITVCFFFSPASSLYLLDQRRPSWIIRMAAPQMSSRASSITAYDIPFGTQTPKNADIFQNTKENDTGDRFGSQQQKNVGTKHGRVIGGTYAVEYEERCSDDMKLGLLERIEGCNLPLTLTKFEYIDNKEYIVLMFADGDKENPYNWSSGRKRFISSLLCMMTLFIGLATTAYSSGINSMVQDLGTSTELGQMGLFCFNMACALAPVYLLLTLFAKQKLTVIALPCTILRTCRTTNRVCRGVRTLLCLFRRPCSR